jgi:hypothetical protein
MTLLDFKKKIYKQMNIYDSSLAAFTDDEDVLARINDVINEAVRFVFLGKGIPQTVEIVHGKPVNKITGQDEIYTSEGEDISFSADKAYAYYFEVDDVCTVEISLGGVVVDTIVHTPGETSPAGTLVAYKDEITGADGSPVIITFKGGSYYNFKNIALYGVAFADEDRIPVFNVWVPHAMTAAQYQVKKAYLDDGTRVPYRISGRNILIHHEIVGKITVESTYFPDTITDATTSATEIAVPVENEEIIIDKACALLTQKPQGYDDYVADVDQGMQNLDQRPSTATARVVRLVDM